MEDPSNDLREQGHREGLVAGRRQGDAEGWEHGVAAGHDLGSLLGSMLHAALSIHDDRAHKLAHDLLAFPLTNGEGLEKEALLSRLQGRFKELCAMHPGAKAHFKENKTRALQF